MPNEASQKNQQLLIFSEPYAMKVVRTALRALRGKVTKLPLDAMIEIECVAVAEK